MANCSNLTNSKLHYEKRVLYSKNNTSNSPLNTEFTQNIQPLRDIATVSLESASIPHSWYNISTQLGNNQAFVGGSLNLFPDANLTGDIDPTTGNPQIEDYITTNFNNIIGAGGWRATLNTIDSTLTIDQITTVGLPTVVFSEDMACLFGLDSSKTYNFDLGSPDLPIVTNPVDLQPIKNIYIREFNFPTGLYSNAISQAASFDIPVTTNYGEINVYRARENHINTLLFEKQASNCNVSVVGLLIVDKNGKLIDLNNVPWSITLGFRQQIYERNSPGNLGDFQKT